MTPKTQFLIPVKKQEIELGKPIPWSVYDADHKLLLNHGVVVTSEHQVEVLVEKGLFREPPRRTHADASARPGAGKNTESPSGIMESSESLDALKLTPGDSLQLQPMVDGQTERYTVRVIGLMKGKSVLVTAPLIDGKLIFIREAQPFLIRAFSGQNVYAFKAKVLKAQHTPFPYLHLSFPDSVQVMRIRKAMRAPVQLIVALSDLEGGHNLGAGRIVDISVGGARMYLGRDVQIRREAITVAFKVILDDHEEYITTRATVRSVAEEDDERGKPVRVVGVQFDTLLPQQRLAIMNLVYQHLLKETL
ncbi:MAG: flagellar brake protein [Hydrogenophilales bacterium]|nr:flagellar brake protein [Hydrogenophilales bacterium]